MLTNYLLIAYRNLSKNKVFSAINIAGLGIGMAAFLIIIHYVRFERSYETFNPDSENVYRITLNIYRGNEYVVTDCETHAGMGGLLKQQFPEVKDFARMFHADGLTDVKIGDHSFLTSDGYFADPTALTLLGMTPIHGDGAKMLTEPNQAVLTVSTAKNLFGNENAVGKSFEAKGEVFQVVGIIADAPPNTHIKYSMLFSHLSLYKNEWYRDDGWNGNNEYTYLLMTPNVNLAAFNQKLADYCRSIKDKLGDARYQAEPIRDIHLYSNKTYEPEVNGSAKAVSYFLIIALFILIIAWVNYINLSTARAIDRAREIGIRKVVGSAKSQLVSQFLIESFLINLIACSVAILLFKISLPLFRLMTGLSLSLDFGRDTIFWLMIIGLLLGGSLLSGLYPAFVLSSFKPVTVLKGKFQTSTNGQTLRKALVIFQFGTTVVLLAGMIAVFQQLNFLRSYDLGMNLDQTVSIRVPPFTGSDSLFNTTFQSLKTELLKSPVVQGVARSQSLPGLSLHELSSSGLSRVGEEENGRYEFYHFGVDADFFKLMNMKLIAGRGFEDGVPNYDEAVLNEAAVKRFGFQSPEEALGQRITFRTRWEGKSSTIIGVIKNFYQRSPKEEHIPMCFNYDERTSYVSVKLQSTDLPASLVELEKIWSKAFPNQVFHYFFMDDQFNQQYQADQEFGTVVATFSSLAVFIACLGLFGLSSFTIVHRTKEIGIRKVLGASVVQIVTLLSKDFAKVVLLAALIALPLAYFAIDTWLTTYATRIDITVWIFMIPVLLIFTIAMATVVLQTISTAIANPTEALRKDAN